MTTSNVELKPCPFKQGTPRLRHSNFGFYITVEVPCAKYEYEEKWRTPYFWKQEDAITFWNTRLP